MIGLQSCCLGLSVCHYLFWTDACFRVRVLCSLQKSQIVLQVVCQTVFFIFKLEVKCAGRNSAGSVRCCLSKEKFCQLVDWQNFASTQGNGIQHSENAKIIGIWGTCKRRCCLSQVHISGYCVPWCLALWWLCLKSCLHSTFSRSPEYGPVFWNFRSEHFHFKN